MICRAAERSEAGALREVLIVEESSGVEVCCVGAEDVVAEVHESVGHEELSAGSEELSVDDAWRYYFAVTHWPVCVSECLLVRGGKERAASRVDEVIEI